MPSRRLRQSPEDIVAKTAINMLRRGKFKKIIPDGTKLESSDISSQERNQSASRPGSKKHTIHVMSSAKIVSTKSLAGVLSSQDSLLTRSASKKSVFPSRSEQNSPSKPVKQLLDLVPEVAKKLSKNNKKTDVKRLREKRGLKQVHSRKENRAKNNFSKNNQIITVGISAQTKSIEAKNSTEDKLLSVSRKAKASKTEVLAAKSPSRKSKTKIPQRINNKTRIARSVSPQRSRVRNVVESVNAEIINSKVIGIIKRRSVSGGSFVSSPRELATIESEYISRISQGHKNAQDHNPQPSSSDLRIYANSKKRGLSFSEGKTPHFSKKRKTSNESTQHNPVSLDKIVISKSNQKSDVKIKESFSQGKATQFPSISKNDAKVASGTQSKTRSSTGRTDRNSSLRNSVETISSKHSNRKANRLHNKCDPHTTDEVQTPLARIQDTTSSYRGKGDFKTRSGEKLKEKLKDRHSQSSRSDILKLASDLQVISTHLKEASSKRHSLRSTKEKYEKTLIVKPSPLKYKTKDFSQSTFQHYDQTIIVANSSPTKTTISDHVRKCSRIDLKTVKTHKGHLSTVASAVKEKERPVRYTNPASEDAINNGTLGKENPLEKTSQLTNNSTIARKDNSTSNIHSGKAKMSKKNVSLSKDYVDSNKAHRRSLRHQCTIYNRGSIQKSSNTRDSISSATEGEYRLFNSKKSRSRRDFVRQKTANRFISVHKVKPTRKTKKTKTSSMPFVSLVSQSLDDKPVTEIRTSTRKSKYEKTQATPKTPNNDSSDMPMTNSLLKSQGKNSMSSPQSKNKSSTIKCIIDDKVDFADSVRATRSNSASIVSKAKLFSNVKPINHFPHSSPTSSPKLPLTAFFGNEPTKLNYPSRKEASRTVSSSTKLNTRSSPPSATKIVQKNTSHLPLQSDTTSRKHIAKASSKTSPKSTASKESEIGAGMKLAVDAIKPGEACRKSLFNSPKKNGAKKSKTISPKILTYEECFQNIISPSLRKTFKHKYVQVSSIPSMLNIQKLVSKMTNYVSILTQVRDAFNKADGDICTFTEIISIDDLLASADCNTECDEPFNDHHSSESEKLHELHLKSGKIVSMVDRKISYSPSWSKRHNRRKNNENPRPDKLSPAKTNVPLEVKNQETVNDEVCYDDDICDELTNVNGDEVGNEVIAEDSDNEIVFNLKKSASPKGPDELNKSVFTQTNEVEITEINSTPEPLFSSDLISGNSIEIVKDLSNTNKLLAGSRATVSSLEEVPETKVEELTSNKTSHLKGEPNKTSVENATDSKGDKLSTATENKDKIKADTQSNVTKYQKKRVSNADDWLHSQQSASNRDTSLSTNRKNKLSSITKLHKSHKPKPMSKPKKKKKLLRKKKYNPVIKVRRIKKQELPYVFKSSIDCSESDSDEDDDANNDDINNSDKEVIEKFQAIDNLDSGDEHDIFLLSSYKDKSRDDLKSPNRPVVKQQTTEPVNSHSDAEDLQSMEQGSVNLRSTKEKGQHQIAAVKTTSRSTTGSLHTNTAETTTLHNLQQFTKALGLSPLSTNINSNIRHNQRLRSEVQPKINSLTPKSKSKAKVDQRSLMSPVSEPKSSLKAALDKESSKALLEISEIPDNNTTNKLSSPIKAQANYRVTRHTASSVGEVNQSREFMLKKSKSLTAIKETNSRQNKIASTLDNIHQVRHLGNESNSKVGKISKLSMSGERNLRRASVVSSKTGLETFLPSLVITPKKSLPGYSYSTKSSPRKKTGVSNYQKIAVMTPTKSARTTRSTKSLVATANLPRDSSRNFSIAMANGSTIKELKYNQATKSPKDFAISKRNEYTKREMRKNSLTQRQIFNKATAKKYDNEPENEPEIMVRSLRVSRPSVKLDKVDLHLRKSTKNANDRDVHMESDLDDSEIAQTADVTRHSPRKRNVHRKRKRISLVLSQQNYFNLKGYKRGRYLLRVRRKRASTDSPKSVRKDSYVSSIGKEQLQSRRQKELDNDKKTKSISSELMRINSANYNVKNTKQNEENALFPTSGKAITFYIEESPEASKKNFRYPKISPRMLDDSSNQSTAELNPIPTPHKFNPLVTRVKPKSSKMTYVKPTGKVTNIKESFSNLDELKRSSKRNKPFKQIVEKEKILKDSKSSQKNKGLGTKLKQETTKTVSVLHSTPSKSFTRDYYNTYSTRSTSKFGKTIQLPDQTRTKIRVEKKRIKQNTDKSPVYSQNNLPVILLTEPTPAKRYDVSSSSLRIKSYRAGTIFPTRPSTTSSDNEYGVNQSYFKSSSRSDSPPFSYIRRHSSQWSDDWTPSSEYGRRMLRVLDRREVLASPLKRKVEDSALSSTNLADDSNIDEYNKTDFEDSFNDYINMSPGNGAFGDSSLKNEYFSDQEEKKAALKNVRFKFNPSDSCIIL